MSKLIALAAVLGAVLIPAAATNAATAPKLSGVVVSKQAARHDTRRSLVPWGADDSPRHCSPTPCHASRLTGEGERHQLADGSLHATAVLQLGLAHHARIRATVLKVNGARSCSSQAVAAPSPSGSTQRCGARQRRCYGATRSGRRDRDRRAPLPRQLRRRHRHDHRDSPCSSTSPGRSPQWTRRRSRSPTMASRRWSRFPTASVSPRSSRSGLRWRSSRRSPAPRSRSSRSRSMETEPRAVTTAVPRSTAIRSSTSKGS